MSAPNDTSRHLGSSRRHFLQASATLGAAAIAFPAILRGQNLNSRINVATIGAGGKGSSDTDETAKAGGHIVALCDVDRGTLDARGAKYPEAKRYRDYRKMLEEMDKQIDAVIVATPDHVHAHASLLAMKMGKHCFCQKPLTHSVYEARKMRETAAKMKVATQMGNQGSAGDGLRRAVEVIQSGAIGPVRELHVWSNRPIWPQGVDRPEGSDPIPDTLDWDLWLGPSPYRPYKKGVYAPFAWRGWMDFGTGALGDMACHTVNMPFRALKLGYPTSIEARSSAMKKETYPSASEIIFQFPKRDGLPPLEFHWYDGGLKPFSAKSHRILEHLNKGDANGDKKLPGSGCLLIGDKGHLYSPDDYGSQFFLLPEKKFEGYKGPKETIARSPGHYKEWIEAIRGGKPAYSNFDVAAYLTEIILLGCVAMRVGKKLEWDGPNMKALNAPEAEQYVKLAYRPGWELPV
jgi:predicted dehydrogenase